MLVFLELLFLIMVKIMIGLEQGKVILQEYNPQWAKEFEKEKVNLEKHLKEYKIDIQHIGSTAIIGCCAKPIIDISITVESLEYAQNLIIPMEKAGYKYRGDCGIPGRLFFKKQIRNIQTHFVHIEANNSINHLSHILFRDYLNCHPEEIEKYCELKRNLSKIYLDDRITYTIEKEMFIENIIKQALIFYNKSI